MFYSHEVLTSRKYGVATVWLVATLGSKSSLKKVSRKAILDVDVQKACETIVTPDAPMALRLQSNLLYGVTRVYAQQCGYVLNDAEAAKNSMRLMFKVLRSGELDAAGEIQGRANQLMLQDDPNFLPDVDLLPMQLDKLELDLTVHEETQNSALSPYNSQPEGSAMGSQQEIGGIIIPGSASSCVGGPVAGGRAFSIRGDSSVGVRMEMGGFLEDDLGLAIDEDGNLHMDGDPARQPPAPLERGERTDVGSASSRAGRGEDVGDVQPGLLGQLDDDGFMPAQDDYNFGQGEAFAGPDQVQAEVERISSEETGEAPLPRRARTKPKLLVHDTNTQLRNGDLALWSANYIDNMNEAIRQKNIHKATSVAKKNAEIWMLGQGNRGPLSIFQGAQLLEAVTELKLTTAGEKHPREDDHLSDSDRRVRARGEPSSDEIGRGFQVDDYMPIMGDDTIEQGRDAPTPLDERHLSSVMPWNQSTGSRRPTGAFSAAGAPTSASMAGIGMQLPSLGRRSSRLTSASPLMGRGANAGAFDDDFQIPGSQQDIEITGADEYELFGPAAGVDTQTAGQSQWQRAVLDGESIHFFEFVQAAILEIDQAREQAEIGDEEDETLRGTVDFETLLRPQYHTCIVAAQAMLHVLSLGTKNLIAVEQSEAFGPITMHVNAMQ